VSSDDLAFGGDHHQPHGHDTMGLSSELHDHCQGVEPVSLDGELTPGSTPAKRRKTAMGGRATYEDIATALQC
jgi:hypothetical protein